ncbi:MAG: adenylate/guanylate cyclase domain-containing protein [Spirochaetales bacterium]|nr:adenylate/guanylate cyclase domain-containing protein [Spirochaetales bacterium]
MSLNKEAKITVLSLLKFFYDEEVFTQLIREFYNSDLDISLAAIRSSGSIGNEIAIPHLYKILDKGKIEQKIEVIRTHARIRAPSVVVMLLKYFTLFQEKELRLEILHALTSINPDDIQVKDLCRTIIQDGSNDIELRVAASDAIIETKDIAYIIKSLKTAPEEILKNIFKKAIFFDQEKAAEVFQEFVDVSKSFSPETLGYFLAGYLVHVKNADYKYLINKLTSRSKRTIQIFLEILFECKCDYIAPLRVFKTLLILPYVNRESESLTGKNLEKIVELMRKESPFVLNELSTITVAHLDTLFSKIRRQFLSMDGVSQREVLLSILFGRLVERYATPALLEDLLRYFKGNRVVPAQKLIEMLKLALHPASEEEKNRLKACIQLFDPHNKAAQLKTQSVLSQVDLERPSLMRRLNRFIRLAGLLGIKTVIKNIQRILEFARTERITYLEETSVVSLCQLYDKTTLDKSDEYFMRWREKLPALKGYIRGMRFCNPPILMKDIAELLVKPELDSEIRRLCLDTVDKTDFKGAKNILPFFIQLLFVEGTEDEMKEAAGKILARWADISVFQQMLDLLQHEEACIRVVGLHVLRFLAERDPSVPREVLVNRCYVLLEDTSSKVVREALVTLISLNDDYAIQVLGDFFLPEKLEDVPAIIEHLPRPLSRDVISLLLGKLTINNEKIQLMFREVLEEVAASESSEELRNALLEALQTGSKQSHKQELEGALDKHTNLLEEAKLEFKFKRENSQILTVFFCDIVSYTEKSSIVNTSTLMKLIRSFEGIVGPVIKGYRGTIVKTLGDGILAVFKHPLNAVLGAIKIQKEIQKYNQYKIDEEKFQVRIGLNTGLVIRKQHDIFGDVVNVASRMQTAANPGDILLTNSTYQEIKNFINCTELGRIKVKGKEEAIIAYAAQDAKENLANILKTAGKKKEVAVPKKKEQNGSSLAGLQASMFAPSFDIPENLQTGKSLLQELGNLFQDLTGAVEEIAKDYHEEYEFKKYLQSKWDALIKNWGKYTRKQVAVVNEMLFKQRQSVGT